MERTDAVNLEAMIAHNREGLLRLMAAVFSMVGISSDGVVSSVSRPVHTLALRVLQPAEAATRRLALILSLGLKTARSGAMKRAGRVFPKDGIPQGSGTRIPAFRLFDPRKYFPELAKGRRARRGPEPRISGFDEERRAFQPMPAAPNPEPDPVRLCQRLLALKAALDDLPKQARRLARVQARRRAAGESLRRTEPMRPGFPPGHRHVQTHEVDEILADCHLLALRALHVPDTS